MIGYTARIIFAMLFIVRVDVLPPPVLILNYDRV